MNNYQLSIDNNQLPEGYKQTEVGVIPEDWDVRKIASLGDVVRGGSPRPAGDPRFFNGSYIPWLTVAAITNISEHQLCVYETYSRLTEEGAKYSRILEENTVIIANSGATLGVAKILSVRCCANDGIAAIINQKYGDKMFVCHFINTKTKELRETVATGNGQPNLNTTLIKEIPIPFPSEEEQRSIATALSDVDALIASLDKLIAKKQAIKTATMQQLLTGKKRLPGFDEGKGYKKTEIGVIPEDWNAAKLGDVAEVIMGQSPKGNSYNRDGNGLPLINGPTEFTDKHPVKVQWTTEPTKLCTSGDLLICVRGSSTGRINVANDEFCIGRGVAAIRANARASTEYLTSQVYLAVEGLLSLSAGSTFPSVDGKAIKSIHIPCPDPQEQRSIATVLSDMDAEIAALEARRAKTQSIKQGMMQELLTGRTRLV